MILRLHVWTRQAAFWAAATVLVGAMSVPVLSIQDVRRTEDLTTYLPPGPGREIVAGQCSACHELGAAVRLRLPPEGWEALVLDMMSRGMPLDADQVDPLLAYLVDVFGPAAPPLTDVNTATRDALAKLPGVTPQRADRLLAARERTGPFTSRDQVRLALDMEAEAFGKIQYYIRAEPPAGKQ